MSAGQHAGKVVDYSMCWKISYTLQCDSYKTMHMLESLFLSLFVPTHSLVPRRGLGTRLVSDVTQSQCREIIGSENQDRRAGHFVESQESRDTHIMPAIWGIIGRLEPNMLA